MQTIFHGQHYNSQPSHLPWQHQAQQPYHGPTQRIQCTDYKIGSLLYGQYMDLGVEAIAFNHSSTAYQDFFPHKNISVSKMMGRIYFINKLKVNNIIDNTVYHHLLWFAIPDVFKYYGKGYEFIKSLDTSNPVVWGCKGISYDENITSIEKPLEKIEEFFNENLDSRIEEHIFNNINKFKSYIQWLNTQY